MNIQRSSLSVMYYSVYVAASEALASVSGGFGRVGCKIFQRTLVKIWLSIATEDVKSSMLVMIIKTTVSCPVVS